MVKQFLDERRLAVRAKRILSVQYRQVEHLKKFSDSKKWHLSTTYDMSAVGLAFYSDVIYAVDDILEIHVVMSGILDIFKGFGRIVRTEKTSGSVYLIAIEFTAAPAEDRTKSAKSKAKRTDQIETAVKRK